MKPGQIRYLQKLSILETPSMREGPWANDTYEHICLTYIDIRNHSKDCILENRFNSLDKLIFETLLNKMKKLKTITLI